MNHLPMIYEVPKIIQKINDSELSKNNIYSCPQTMFKFHPEFDHILAEILKKDKKGVLYLIKDNNKVVIDEFNDLTWSGISIINPIIFKEKNFSSGSFNIWDTVLPNYLNNGNVSAHKSNDLWIDVGTHERLKLANSLYNDQN